MLDRETARQALTRVTGSDLRSLATKLGVKPYFYTNGQQRWLRTDTLRARILEQCSPELIIKMIAGDAPEVSPKPQPTREPAPQTETTKQTKQNGMLEAYVRELVNAAMQEHIPDLTEIEKRLQAAIEKKLAASHVTVCLPEQPDLPTLDDELAHKQLPELLALMRVGRPVYLYGESGCGKSFAVRQAARALKKEYFELGVITAEHKLVGHTVGMDAKQYVTTPFREACTRNAVCLLDEFDRSHPAAAVTLNNALESGRCDFPGAPESTIFDEGFLVAATGNTRMAGGDSKFTTGARQDASISQRFYFLPWEPDYALERALVSKLAGDHAASIIAAFSAMRELAKQHVFQDAMLTPRDAERTALAVSFGISPERALEYTVFAKAPAEVATKLRDAVKGVL